MAFNKCRFCGESEVPERADFCISCGRSMKNDERQQEVINAANPSPVKTGFASGFNRFFIGCVVLSIGLLAILYALLKYNSEPNKTFAPKYPTAMSSEEMDDTAAIEEMLANETKQPAVNSRSTWTKEERAKRKKEGVFIGMTKEEVLASKWGKPKERNKSTNASGTSEQWVYGGRNYLYFDDDILTSIQN